MFEIEEAIKEINIKLDKMLNILDYYYQKSKSEDFAEEFINKTISESRKIKSKGSDKNV